MEVQFLKKLILHRSNIRGRNESQNIEGCSEQNCRQPLPISPKPSSLDPSSIPNPFHLFSTRLQLIFTGPTQHIYRPIIFPFTLQPNDTPLALKHHHSFCIIFLPSHVLMPAVFQFPCKLAPLANSQHTSHASLALHASRFSCKKAPHLQINLLQISWLSAAPGDVLPVAHLLQKGSQLAVAKELPLAIKSHIKFTKRGGNERKKFGKKGPAGFLQGVRHFRSKKARKRKALRSERESYFQRGEGLPKRQEKKTRKRLLCSKRKDRKALVVFFFIFILYFEI